MGVDDSTGLPVCRLAEAPDGAVPKTQNVVVLSMADCKAIELWGIEKPQLPREAGARERAQAAAERNPPPPPDDGRGVGRALTAVTRAIDVGIRPSVGSVVAARLFLRCGEVPPR